MPEKHSVSPENAPKFLEWLKDRGGVAVWRSVNLSNLGASWSTPARQKDGSPTQKPTWEASSQPERIITDPAEVEVIVDREVKRFHVAVRRGSQGLTLKCTDASTRKIRAAVEKAGEGAYYAFDYMTQEAVILAPASRVPLSEWKPPEAA